MNASVSGVLETYHFVPPGHLRIIPFRVLAAWQHAETKAWLSIQALGPAMALVWRPLDSYAATPVLVGEVCESLDRADNFRRALALAEFHLIEGPPKGLLESMQRSREFREERARKGGYATQAKRRAEAEAASGAGTRTRSSEKVRR
jgi:general stress protein YciG